MSKSNDANALSYNEAVAELERILDTIESEEMDIDQLGPQVERATQLIRLCRDKLSHTELRVREALEALSEAAADLDGEPS